MIHLLSFGPAGPEVQMIPRVIEFLGYAPYHPVWLFGQRLKAIRSTLGFPQEQFTNLAKPDESTIAKWKSEEHKLTRHDLAAYRNSLCSLGQ